MPTSAPDRIGNFLTEDTDARTDALRTLARELASSDLDGISRFSDLLLATESVGGDWRRLLVEGGWSEEDAYGFVLSFSGVLFVREDGRIDDSSISGPYASAEEIAAARTTVPEIPSEEEIRQILLRQARAERAVGELCRKFAEATAAGLAAAVIFRDDVSSSAQNAVLANFSRVWVPLAARKEAGNARVLRILLLPLPSPDEFDVEGQRFCCAALLSDVAVRALAHERAAIRVAALHSLGSLLEDGLLPKADREKLLDRIESTGRKDRTPKVRRRAVATLVGDDEWYLIPECIGTARRAAFLNEALAYDDAPSVRLCLATGLFLLAREQAHESKAAAAKLGELATSAHELPVVNRRAQELTELYESAAELDNLELEA